MILTRNPIQQEAQCQVSRHSTSSLPPRRGIEHSQGFSQSCHDMSMLISDCNLYVVGISFTIYWPPVFFPLNLSSLQCLEVSSHVTLYECRKTIRCGDCNACNTCGLTLMTGSLCLIIVPQHLEITIVQNSHERGGGVALQQVRSAL